MAARILALLSIFCVQSTVAQFQAKESELIQKVNKAASDSQMVSALGALAEFYSVYRLDKKADSIYQKQLLTAQLSLNKNLVVATLFDNSITNISNWTTAETFDRILAFLQKGLEYSKETGRKDYEALAYIKKSTILRKRGKPDEALHQATMAFSTLPIRGIDSLKAILFLELGDIFLAKGEPVNAFKNYNNAYDIAYDISNMRLQSEIYHHFAQLYQTLDQTPLSEAQLFKSVELNEKNNNDLGLLLDYIDLARLTDKKEYFDKAIDLANQLGIERYRLLTRRLLFAYYMAVEKNPVTALNYLNNNPDLKQSYINSGLPNYYFNIGSVYFYSNNPDSAIKYFNLAESDLQKTLDINSRVTIYKEMADCYSRLGETVKAIAYFEKAKELGSGLNDLKTDTMITHSLSELYAQAGNFKKAFEYSRQYDRDKNELQQLADQRQVVLLEVDHENSNREKEMRELANKKLREKNLQYMGITIFLAAVFTLLILIGMFPVSTFTIKVLSYFSLICLFELIVVFLEDYMHRVTYGEPLNIWIFKVVLIAILVPIQHFVEHALIRFMESRKLIQLRNQLSLRKWITKIKKPLPKDLDITEDTAVL
jgi:tetratricopeptide (TPR) repeat protein